MRKRGHEPERARDEGTLVPLLAARAVQKPAAGVQLFPDGVDRACETVRRTRRPAHPRPAQNCCVERIRAGELRIGAELLRPAAPLDERLHRLALLSPVSGVRERELSLLHEVERAVERHPDAHLRGGVVAMVVQLPDPGVVVLPRDRHAVHARGEDIARAAVERVSMLDVERRRLEEVAPRPEL